MLAKGSECGSSAKKAPTCKKTAKTEAKIAAINTHITDFFYIVGKCGVNFLGAFVTLFELGYFKIFKAVSSC